jgi:hypothetical protein
LPLDPAPAAKRVALTAESADSAVVTAFPWYFPKVRAGPTGCGTHADSTRRPAKRLDRRTTPVYPGRLQRNLRPEATTVRA